MNFYIRIILNFNCIRYFFIDYSIFIIYDIISFDCNIKYKRVILTIFNVLHIFDINVNLFSIKKFLNINIEIVFYKKDCVLI